MDKPRMVDVTGHPYLTQDPAPGLDIPHVIWNEEGRAYCLATEFQAWRKGLTNTSGVTNVHD